MSYFKSYDSRGLGAVAAVDLAPAKGTPKKKVPSLARRPLAKLLMSARAPSAGLPSYPFTTGVTGVVLTQPSRSDLLITRIPAPTNNFAAPLSRPVIVPVVEYPGAGTTYSGLVAGNPPGLSKIIDPIPGTLSGANTPPRAVPAQTVMDARADAAAEADLQETAVTQYPAKKPNYLLYGAIALGAWWFLRRNG